MSELKTLRLIVLVVCGAADNHWPSVWWFIFRTYGLCPCLNWIALIVYIVMCACFILVRCIILEFIIPSYYYLVYSLTFYCSLNSYLVFWKAWCLFIFHILSNHIFRLPIVADYYNLGSACRLVRDLQKQPIKKAVSF